MSETTERSYYLVESMYFEKLLRTHFMLTQSTLLFEHLLSHSDRPMFLSARKVCEMPMNPSFHISRQRFWK